MERPAAPALPPPEPAAGTPRWLRQLIDAAARAGVRVSAAAAQGGVLTLTVGAAERPLKVEVKPRTPGHGAFLRTARFDVCYCGAAELAASHRQDLERLGAVLRGLEARLPATFEARVGIGVAGDGPPTGEPGAPYFTVERATDASGAVVRTELLVRLTSRCNQDCPFCSAPPPHGEPTPVEMQRWLDTILPGLPDPTVSLTGGEPALWPGLRELVVALCAREPGPRVKIQTNAVAFADAAALDGWPRSLRLAFFVSFHGATAEVYDRCTGSRGQLDRAVAGIRNLLAGGHDVTLNLVASRHNVDHLGDWVRGVESLFPAPRRPRLHFSITMCPEHRAGAPDCLVRYGELGPRLEDAARLAAALGLECEPLLASSHAAIPPCLIDPALRRRGPSGAGEIRTLHDERDVGVEDLGKRWVKARACAACVENRACLGLPRAYAARFGLAELRPITGG